MTNPLRPSRGLHVQNDNGSTIPPRSLVVAKSITTSSDTDSQEGETVIHVDQFDGMRRGVLLVTGEASIAGGGTGQAYCDPMLFVSIDKAVATPVPGEMWGPVPGSWTISRGGVGFFSMGYTNNGGSPTRGMFMRNDQGVAWGKLTGALNAPTAATSPTTGLFDIWHPDQTSGVSAKPLTRALNTSLRALTGVNYDASLSGSSGYLCQVVYGYEGFKFIWVGCKAS